ncbi:MAG: AraC family transcriptional regulator [Pararobbsia sp.]
MHIEQQWRKPPVLVAEAGSEPPVIVTRGTSLHNQTGEVFADGSADFHTLSLSLRQTTVAFWKNDKLLCDGLLPAGMLTIVEPGQSCRAIYNEPYDALRVYLSQGFLKQCYEDAYGRPHSGDILLSGMDIFRDSRLAGLIRALASADENGHAFGRVYLDALSTSVAACSLARHFRVASGSRGTKPMPLAKWRLNRTVEYVKAHLTEPISLTDMANVAGLTRMYFAAQFREATGSSPHAFLLRERITRAQEMLANPAGQIVDIAVNVGFQSQAHFTTVFKRLVGETPHRWRQRTLR